MKNQYTRKGEMLLELRRKEKKAAQTFSENLQEVLGEEACERKSERLITLLLLDLEETITDKEIYLAIRECQVLKCEPIGRGCFIACVKTGIPLAIAT